jgi:hypothetical protein
VKLTIYLHLLTRLEVHAVLPPLPNFSPLHLHSHRCHVCDGYRTMFQTSNSNNSLVTGAKPEPKHRLHVAGLFLFYSLKDKSSQQLCVSASCIKIRRFRTITHILAPVMLALRLQQIKGYDGSETSNGMKFMLRAFPKHNFSGSQAETCQRTYR